MVATATNQSMMNYVNSQRQNLDSFADSIPNYNIYTRLAKAGLKGISGYVGAKTQKRQLQFQADVARYQAEGAKSNAEFAMRQAQLNAKGATQEMYNVYRMGEHQSMLQGVSDAQVIHGQRARTASSGVRMDQGSKAEIDTTNRMSEEINRKALQESIIHNASQMKIQATNYEVQGMLEQANYMAQAYILEGDARASEILAKQISPLGEGLTAFANSLISSYGGNIAGGSNGFGGSAGSFGMQGYTSGSFFGTNWSANDGSLFGDIQGMFSSGK